jgi:phosphoribosylformylglycinamidine synthase
VIKPLVGADSDVNSDASVTRPLLDSTRGLAMAQALLPAYSAIDAYHMTACTIDEAVRRLMAVGARFDHIGGVDNFCWPNIQYDPATNPDGRFKAAQLVRACRALKFRCSPEKTACMSTGTCRDAMVKSTRYRPRKRCSLRP